MERTLTFWADMIYGWCLVCNEEYVESYVYVEEYGQYLRTRRTCAEPCKHEGHEEEEA